MPVWKPHPVYFREAVRSILRQTLDDMELLVVELPSEVSAERLLAEFQDSRIRYVQSPVRASLVAQRNLGLAEARPDLIALLDADDVAEPTRLQQQVEYLLDHPEIDLLGSQIRIIGQGGETLGFRCFPLELGSIVDPLRSYVPLSHPSLLFRKEVILAAGGYQYTRHPALDDYELYCRLAIAGCRFSRTILTACSAIGCIRGR